MRRSLELTFVALIMWPCAYTIAQSNRSSNQSKVVPETAFISPSKYTNAFFGFSLPLPRGIPLRQMMTPVGGSSQRFLFGAHAEQIKGSFSSHPVLSVMQIMYELSPDRPNEAAQKFVAGPKNLKATHLAIGGRDFWKSESEESGKTGKMQTLFYAASLGGYIIEFSIVSFDTKVAVQLGRSVESISFFDPSEAAQAAGPDSRLYDPSGGHIAKLDGGTVWANTYTNDTLGFTYQFPAGWAVANEATRIKVIEGGHQLAYGDNPSAAQEHEFVQKCARYPLMVSRYPEGTKTQEVNPLIALMVIDSSCFPGDIRFPSSLDDRQRVAELSEMMRSLLANAPFLAHGQNSVTAASDGERVWIDVSSTAKVETGGNAPVTVFTAIAFTQIGDYWAGWMFMAGSQAELDQLEHTPISFSSPSH